MKEIGTVVEKHKDKAVVRFAASPACSGCKMGCAARGKDRIIEAYDPVNVNVGDTVEVEFEERKLLWGAFLSYLLPVLFFLAGYAGGSLLGSTAGIKGEGPAILGSFLFLVLSFVLLKLGFDRGFLKTADFIPVIVKRYK